MESIILADEWKNKIRTAGDVKGAEKLGLYQRVLDGLMEIERRAARDFDFPLLEIQKAQDMLADVQSVVNRLKAAAEKTAKSKKDFKS